MEDLEVSINWESERKEDEVYKALDNIYSSVLGICFSIYGDDDINSKIKSSDEKIQFDNSIIKDTRNNNSNLSVEGTIAALRNRKFHFYIPPDLIKYIKKKISNKNILYEYEKCFPNNKYIYDIGKKFFEKLMDMGYSSQAAYSLCGGFFIECGWNPNTFQKGGELKDAPEGLFGLKDWKNKYNIINKLNLNLSADIYGINDEGYIDKSRKARVQRIPFKSFSYQQLGIDYNSAPTNKNPKLFMCTEEIWLKIFDEYIKELPKAIDDDKTYFEYFTYDGTPMQSYNSNDIDHQLLYATYLFKTDYTKSKTYDNTITDAESKNNLPQNDTSVEDNGEPENLYRAENEFVQQLLIAYLLAEYCNGVEVEKLSLKDIFGSWGSLPTMNSEFLVNTYVGKNVITPIEIPPPNNDGITVINHTENMFKRTKKIEYIILHYTAGVKSDVGASKKTVNTLDKRGFSSDFVVDDGMILQFADDPGKWASTAVQKYNPSTGTPAGKGASNSNAVSIEICSTLDKPGKWVPNDPHFRFTDATLGNVAFLCKHLIKTYNIPKEHIIRHYDIMGKCCPGIIGWNLGKGSNNENKYRDFVDSLYAESPEIGTNNSIQPKVKKNFILNWFKNNKDDDN